MATFGATVTDRAWAVLLHVGALKPVIFTAVPRPTRDLELGQTTGAGTPYPVEMLLRAFRRSEMDESAVVAGDMLARIPKVSLPVQPTTRDTVSHEGIAGHCERDRWGEWQLVAISATKATTGLEGEARWNKGRFAQPWWR